MSTATPTSPRTAQEPEAAAVEPPAEPEGFYEIIDDEVREKPAMGAFEVWIASQLQTVLGTFAQANRLGRVATEMLFTIDQTRRLQRRPDVAFVSRERWPHERRTPRTAAWEVVPDLAVEVLSPTNRSVEDAAKLDDYFRAGVRQVWLIYPNVARIYVHDSPTAVRILAAAQGDALDGGDLLPGFRLPLADLFDEPAE